MNPSPRSSTRPWWSTAVVYEVYPRSFADGNGDGIGDLAGLRHRLPYLRELGVNAIWIAPWYPSPMADGGYDVADYCDIAPEFGTLAEAEALIDEAHAMGLRVIIDMVANHTSSAHPWFLQALAAGAGSPQRQRYFFRDGRGQHGEQPPNDWISAFGGPAWTRITDADGTPGQWYLHTFAPEQPDLDWEREEVREDFDAILRFWLDRGVDGIRVDA
uniref:alpha-amylase family glycosyl hydrolase n=1 Tax=Kineococcus sp. SYSU DK007 TaxID=3383128 RepID=UPI003D7CE34A